MHFAKSVLGRIRDSSPALRLRGFFFHVGEIISGYRREKQRFMKNMGYPLDLKNPQSFSHHIVWKKLYDRDPILPVTCDKFRVRQYVKDVLGEKEANEVLIPLLYASDDPGAIPFERLRGGYIIKPNHNSGSNIIVEEGTEPDREKIISDLKRQLASAYGIFKHEWAYGKIKKRMFVIEKLLKDTDGGIPKDYKFHMIHGRCAFIQVDYDRFLGHSRSLYDTQWNFIPATLKYRQGPVTPKPERLEAMLSLAARLAKGFDYVRVDLYNIGARIYFGELTHYPGSGVEKFTPQSLDFELGKYWVNKS